MNLKTKNSRLFSERGVALIAVLWIFIFLFAIAMDFSVSVREEGFAAHRYAEEAEDYYSAIAGFQSALYEIVGQSFQQTRATPQASYLFDGQWRDGKVGEAAFRFRLIDEGGKINLNRVDEETLKRIFVNLGIEEPQGSALAGSIMDWRDEDDLHRTNGAESDYYSSLTPGYTAANGPFTSVEELLWVKGMTPAIFFGSRDNGAEPVGLKDIFSVDSPFDRVNLRTARPKVIHGLTGLSLEKSRSFVQERERLSEKTMADLLKILALSTDDAVLRQFIFINPSIVTVEAVGSQSGSFLSRGVKGVVRIVGNRGVEIVRWLDRDVNKGQSLEFQPG